MFSRSGRFRLFNLWDEPVFWRKLDNALFAVLPSFDRHASFTDLPAAPGAEGCKHQIMLVALHNPYMDELIDIFYCFLLKMANSCLFWLTKANFCSFSKSYLNPLA